MCHVLEHQEAHSECHALVFVSMSSIGSLLYRYRARHDSMVFLLSVHAKLSLLTAKQPDHSFLAPASVFAQYFFMLQILLTVFHHIMLHFFGFFQLFHFCI